METFKEYTDPEIGFSIKCAINWMAGEEQEGLAVSFRAPIDLKHPDFIPNVNIVVQDLSEAPEFMDLKQFTVLSLSQVEQMFDNFTIVEKVKDCLMDDIIGYEVVYTGSQQGLELKFWQKWAIKKPKAFVLTYTATEDQYDSFLPTAKLMIDSFRFL